MGYRTLKLLTILLTIMFVGLKLTNHIDWSWIWVISPLLILITIWCMVFTFVLVQQVKLHNIRKERESKRPKSVFQRKMQEMMDQAKNK